MTTRSSKRFLVLLALIAGLHASPWLTPAFANQPASIQTQAEVVCFGDSITKRGYSEVLARLIGVDAINAGVGGNSTAKALRRISATVLAHKPDVVVILFGTNDLRADADQVYVPVAQYKVQ